MSEAATPQMVDQNFGQDMISELAQRNIENLEAAGEVGSFFAGLYREAIAAEPAVQNVVMFPTGKEEMQVLRYTGGAARHQGYGDGVHPELIIDTKDGWGHFEELMRTRPVSTRVSAEKVGIDPDSMTPQDLAAFIFLHELGHTVDYQKRFPVYEDYRHKREQELASLPIPGYNPAQLMKFLDSVDGRSYMLQNRDALRKAGVKNANDLLYMQEKAYHSIDSEDFPDQFAARIMRRLTVAA